MTLATVLDIGGTDSRATSIPSEQIVSEHGNHQVCNGHSSHDDDVKTAALPTGLETDTSTNGRDHVRSSSHDNNATTAALPTELEAGASNKLSAPVRISIALRPVDSKLSVSHGGVGNDLSGSDINCSFESMSASAVSSASSSFSSNSSFSSYDSFVSATADILEAMEMIPPLPKSSKKKGRKEKQTQKKVTMTNDCVKSPPLAATSFEASNGRSQEQQHRAEEEGKSIEGEELEMRKKDGKEGSRKDKRREASEEDFKEERRQKEELITNGSSNCTRGAETTIKKRSGCSEMREKSVNGISSETAAAVSAAAVAAAAAAAAATAAATTTITDIKKTHGTPSSTSNNQRMGLLLDPPSSSHASSMFASPSPIFPSSILSSSSSPNSPTDDADLPSSNTMTFQQLKRGGGYEGIEEGMYEDEGAGGCKRVLGLVEEEEGVFEVPTFNSFMSREAAAKREAVRVGWRAFSRVVVGVGLAGIVAWVFMMYR